jgi:hypothetical protein
VGLWKKKSHDLDQSSQEKLLIRPNSLALAVTSVILFVAKRLAPDQQVVFANRPAHGFRLRTQLACNSRILLVECKLADRAGKKTDQKADIQVAAVYTTDIYQPHLRRLFPCANCAGSGPCQVLLIVRRERIIVDPESFAW